MSYIDDIKNKTFVIDNNKSKTNMKGLEALENIKENCDLFDNGYKWDQEFSERFDADIDIIEQDLKEHEQYKVAETELGVTFPTLIEILKQDYLWFKYEDKIVRANIFQRTLEESIGRWFFIVEGIPVATDLKEGFGKTWAFTRKELE